MAWEQLDSLLGYNLAKLSGNYDITGTGGKMSGNFLTLGNTPVSQTNPSGATTKTWEVSSNCKIRTHIADNPYDTLECWNDVNINGNWKSVGGLAVGAVSSRNISVDTVIFINHDIQKAFACATIYRDGTTFYNGYANYINKEETSVFYNIIMELIPPEYNWQSVPSISGKNGISLLSHVRDDSILTGQDISNLTPAQVKLESTTQISSLIANVPIGKAVKAIYAGKVDFLGIMKDNSASSSVRISVAGNNVYLASFISQKNYIGFIIDDENEVAKLSYIMPILFRKQ